MAVQQGAELLIGPQAPSLFLAVDLGEVPAQGGQPLPVALLEPHHRAVELALGLALGTLEPHAPGQLIEAGQPVEVGEPGVTAHAPRERPPGPDPGRIEGEGAQEGVDVVGHVRFFGSRRPLVGGHHLGAGGPQGGVFGIGEPHGHPCNVACGSTQLLTLLSG